MRSLVKWSEKESHLLVSWYLNISKMKELKVSYSLKQAKTALVERLNSDALIDSRNGGKRFRLDIETKLREISAILKKHDYRYWMSCPQNPSIDPSLEIVVLHSLRTNIRLANQLKKSEEKKALNSSEVATGDGQNEFASLCHKTGMSNRELAFILDVNERTLLRYQTGVAKPERTAIRIVQEFIRKKEGKESRRKERIELPDLNQFTQSEKQDPQSRRADKPLERTNLTGAPVSEVERLKGANFPMVPNSWKMPANWNPKVMKNDGEKVLDWIPFNYRKFLQP